MAKKGYKHKTVAFRLDNIEDIELYDDLQKLAYGDFSRVTKEMWKERIAKFGQKRLKEETK